MEKRNQIKEFCRWLKENKIWIQYLRAFRSQNLPNPNLKKFIEEHQPVDFISCAFTWDNTPEGFNYWITIHFEWDKYYLKSNG